MTCLRDGREVKVNYNDIMVGDIVKIKSGMNIPVDGVIIKASGVTNNESAITGESMELKKEALEICKVREEEKEEEYLLQKYFVRRNHDIPSPIMVSGT